MTEHVAPSLLVLRLYAMPLTTREVAQATAKLLQTTMWYEDVEYVLQRLVGERQVRKLETHEWDRWGDRWEAVDQKMDLAPVVS